MDVPINVENICFTGVRPEYESFQLTLMESCSLKTVNGVEKWDRVRKIDEITFRWCFRITGFCICTVLSVHREHQEVLWEAEPSKLSRAAETYFWPSRYIGSSHVRGVSPFRSDFPIRLIQAQLHLGYPVPIGLVIYVA